jgi:hypothetical protein
MVFSGNLIKEKNMYEELKGKWFSLYAENVLLSVKSDGSRFLDFSYEGLSEYYDCEEFEIYKGFTIDLLQCPFTEYDEISAWVTARADREEYW